MSKINICFAGCLVIALAGCKPADGTTQAAASLQAPANGSSPVQAAAGKEFEEESAALVRGAARMQASVVACNLASRVQTDQVVASQRARYVSQGYDGGAFDRLHGAEFAETLEKINAAEPQQKTQSCEQIKAFGEKMSQMGKQMQDQMKDQH